MCDVYFLCYQESAVDFQEIEEALMIIKQRKAKDNQDGLDFLEKVDGEKVKGKIINKSLLNICQCNDLICRELCYL